MVVGGWGVTGGRDGGDNGYADGYEFNTGSTTELCWCRSTAIRQYTSDCSVNITKHHNNLS